LARLQTRIAIITGGTRVVIADMLIDEGEALARELGKAAAFQCTDVSKEEGWRIVRRDAVWHMHMRDPAVPGMNAAGAP